MSQETEPGYIDEELWNSIAAEFQERRRSGENPTIESFAQRYPHQAALIRKRLRSLSAMYDDATDPSGGPANRSAANDADAPSRETFVAASRSAAAQGGIPLDALPPTDLQQPNSDSQPVHAPPADFSSTEGIGARSAAERIAAREVGREASQDEEPEPQRNATQRNVDNTEQFPLFLRGYQLLRQVGRGGMGVVYEAIEESLQRRVALKLLPRRSGSDPRLFERFEREMDAAGKLHHDHIVPVYSVGEDQGYRFYSMQFIDGTSLDQMVGTTSASVPSMDRTAPSTRRRGPSTEGTDDAGPSVAEPWLDRSAPDYFHKVARIGLDAARALHYAHSQGVLHRDIKPANLILDREGKVWIADFGIAKAMDQEDLTATGEIVGTLRYLPPERLHGISDIRGDVYSLGLTLYELATGERAFGHLQPTEMMPRRFQQDPTPIEYLAPQVPTNLAAIIEKAIRANPTHRYQSAAHLAEDLDRFLAGEPVQARPPGPAERVERYIRRHPALSAIALVLFLVSSIGVPLLSSLYMRAEANKRLAEANEAEAVARKLDAETAAERAQRAERESLRQEMRLGLIRGVERATQGSIASALPWFLRSWEIAETLDLPDWRHLARENLALWGSRLPTRLVSLEHSGHVNAVALSPDGKTLLTGGRASAPRLWNLVDGTHRTLAGGDLRSHFLTVWTVAFAPDGTRAASGSSDGQVRLWEVASGELLASLPHPGNAPNEVVDVWKVVFTPDGKSLLTADGIGTVRRWDAHTGKNIGFENGAMEIAEILPPRTRILGLAVSPDGSEFAYGWRQYLYRVALPSGDRVDSKSLVDTRQSGPDPRMIPFQRVEVQDLVYSKNGRQLFVVRRDDDCIRLNVPFLDTVTRYNLGHGQATAIALDESQNRMVLGTNDGRCLQWTPGIDSRLDPNVQSPYRINDLKLGNRGDKEILIIAAGPHVTLWSLPKNIFRHERRLAPPPRRIYPLPNGEIFARSLGGISNFFLGEKKEGWSSGPHPPLGLGGGHMVAIPDSMRLVADGVQGEYLILTRVPKGYEVDRRRYARPGGGHMMTLAASPKHIVTVSSGGYAHSREIISLWDIDQPEPLRQRQRQHQQTQLACFVGPDRFALSGPSGSVEVWRTEDLEPVATRDSIEPLSGSVSALAGDGRSGRVAIGTTSGMIGLWDIELDRIVSFFNLHRGSIETLRFSPDGKLLLSAGMDGFAWRWDLKTGMPLGPPIRFEEGMIGAEWHEGDRGAIVSSEVWTAQVEWTRRKVPVTLAETARWIEELLGDEAKSHFDEIRSIEPSSNDEEGEVPADGP